MEVLTGILTNYWPLTVLLILLIVSLRFVNAYLASQLFKLLALGAIIYITYIVPNWFVAAVSVFIIGTLIASEAFILMLARSLRKEPTDENIVKLFITLIFRDKDQAKEILDQYKK